MNCRRVNSLLSAYLDSELTGAEMLAVREHLGNCASCREEHETLYETKRLVASLAFRAPRAELESLLMGEAARASQTGFGGMATRFLSWLNGGEGVASTTFVFTPLYLRPLAATALLSIAGLWIASISLDAPNDMEGVLPPTPGTLAYDSGIPGPASPLAANTGFAPSPAYAAPVAVAWSSGGASPMMATSYGQGPYSGNLSSVGSATALMPVAASASPLPVTGTSTSSVVVQGGWSGSASFGPGAAALLSAARRLASH